MAATDIRAFQSLKENVGHFNLTGKTVLIPEMNRIGCNLIAATFRGYGINAIVMDTYKGLDLGLEYSSGKECYPCQVTLGDVLYNIKAERERLGEHFNVKDYIYFMPEAHGPCRFGMYNKYQRIVLDSFPELKDLKIGSLSTEDGYSLSGIIDDNLAGDLRKTSYFAMVAGDVIDRLLWRVRPYEREPGMADEFIEKSLIKMVNAFERYGLKKEFKKILDQLAEIVEEGKLIIDDNIPQKPLIGIVGEIYLRSHVQSNQNVIKTLEKHGAEVVNASIAEWVNFVTYSELRGKRNELRLGLKQLKMIDAARSFKKVVGYKAELLYQEMRQKQIYEKIAPLIDLAFDHKISHLEEILDENRLFSFDIGTEACLSISGILAYMKEGFNGVVNVYPFTCMPSTTTSAVISPVMNRMGMPYLDTPYDSSIQPGREASIRTFMYQAHQHMKRNGRKSH